MKIKTAFFFIFFLYLNLGSSQFSFGQFIGQREIPGFTTPSDIQILRDHSETNDLIEIGDSYAKARGVTVFSSMNNLNNRAKKKLLEEAAIRGASHVWIIDKLPDDAGLFGRLVSYNAVFYRHPDLKMDIEAVKQAFEANELKGTFRMVSNRNAFGAKNTNADNFDFANIDPDTGIFEKNGRVFVQVTNRRLPGAALNTKTYEVTAMDEDSILLVEELVENKKYVAHLFRLKKK